MRILVLGAAGQVGFELMRSLAGFGELYAVDRVADPAIGVDIALDIGDLVELKDRVVALAPDLIVNAAAYTAVDLAEDEPELADRINHLALRELGQAAAELGALVVHYSTDYVFPGDGASGSYAEGHPAAPKSVYGVTKLAGEQALAASGCAHLLLRTAWVYGARGRNFMLTILRAAAQRPELTVVDDQVGSPTTARFLADTTAAMVRRWLDGDADVRAELQGACHVVCAGHTTWCGFAREIVAQACAMGLLERATPVRGIATGQYPAKAQRPAYSVLDTQRLSARFGITPMLWSVGLRHTLLELAQARQSLAAIGFEVKRC
jgi:dTDP-4-dehydrorhamnose reductase